MLINLTTYKPRRALTPLPATATLRDLTRTMEALLSSADGAVEVTSVDADRWTVCGPDQAVRSSRVLMQAAGCALVSSHYDPAPDLAGDVDEYRYDYWRS